MKRLASFLMVATPAVVLASVFSPGTADARTVSVDASPTALECHDYKKFSEGTSTITCFDAGTPPQCTICHS